MGVREKRPDKQEVVLQGNRAYSRWNIVADRRKGRASLPHARMGCESEDDKNKAGNRVPTTTGGGGLSTGKFLSRKIASHLFMVKAQSWLDSGKHQLKKKCDEGLVCSGSHSYPHCK